MTDTIPIGRDADPLAFLAGGGEMGERIRAFDWSTTVLGPIEQWPQSLKTSVSTSLGCAFPIILWWGPALTVLYNDEYRPAFGSKHPWALGQPGAVAWAAIWDVIGPMLAHVMERGEATRSRDLLLHIDRHGYPEEAYFSFSYSPIQAENSQIGGVFCPVIETTDKVIGERRLRTLRDLAAACQGVQSEQAVFQSAASVLAANAQDVPFAIIYRIDEIQQRAELESAAGIAHGSPAAPKSVSLRPEVPQAPQIWSLATVVEKGKAAVVTDLATHFEQLPTGAWKVPAHSGIVLPILLPGQSRPCAVLAAAVSPMRSLDADYRTFFELLATQIAAGLADAKALDDERRRAEALAEIDRAKTAFFSNVSHEFRTPLTLLLGPVEDALHDAKERWQRERLEVIRRNGLRLQKLVNTLLDFSRLEAGRVQASYEPTELAALTAELASNFRSAVEKAGMQLFVNCSPLGEPVYVDRDMYEKVVLNLLSNAFKFTLEGEIEVRLRDAGTSVELSVRDTGTGITEDQLPHVFERFHRIEGARARTHEGTGIGLALVQELVKLHGGTVSVRSAAGQGSTFTVALPKGMAHLPTDRIGEVRPPASTALAAEHYLEEALRWLPGETTAPPDSALMADVPRAAAAEGQRPRIVWADDNADMRDYVSRLLSPLYDVEAVPDGEAALAAVRRRPADLVLADVMMPRLDGFGLLRALRADEHARSTPMILLSARAGEESRVDGMKAGADDYLVKPFSARELIARVDAHLKMARLRAEGQKALRAKDDELEAIIQGTPFMLNRCSRDLRYRFVSRAYAAMIGRKPEDVSGKLIVEFMGEEGLRTILPHVEKVLAGHYVEYETDVDFHGVGIRSLHVVYTPDKDKEGNVNGWIASILDITERRKAEQALRQSQEALQDADRRKDEFLATLAHELRNPLAPIRNGLQILRLGGTNGEMADDARKMMDRQLAHMVRLIDDLLDLSRISQGKIELRRERIELAKVVQQAVETSRPLIEQAGHELLIDVPTSPVFVDADMTRLAQVFSNLLNNAAKYTEHGGRIRLAVQRQGGEVQMSVRDNGIGIPAHMLPRVFDIFTQVDRNLERAQGGLGIGLSIVRRLVEMHGGSVEARSDGHGMGSEFVVRLPVLLSLARPNVDPEHAIGLSTRRRILVVDDNRDAAMSLAMMLKLMGNEARTAHDGYEALDVAAVFRPDLILLDIGMPRLNGHETAKRIREQPWGKGVVLVALTGWGYDEDRRRSDAAGFDAHMVKPIELAALEKLLANLQLDTA